MRWDSLFDDLEAQLAEQGRAQMREEIAENIRIERATEEMLDRLLHFYGSELSVRLVGETEVRAKLGPCASEYLCLESERSQWIVRFPAVEYITLPQVQGYQPGRTKRGNNIRFSSVIRGILRDRSRCEIFGRTGDALAEGTLIQVAKDFLIISTHPRDEFVRSGRISGQLLIPLDSIGWMVATTLN